MTLLTLLCSWSFKRNMLAYGWRLICVCSLLCCLNLPVYAQVILSAEQDSPAVRNFAQQLAQALPQHAIHYMPRSQLETHTSFAEDTQLILLGPKLLDWRLQLTQSAPPTLIMQVSRVQAHKRFSNRQPKHLTFLWSDPPLDRQIALLKTMLPGVKHIGVLYGDHSEFLLKEIEQALQAEQLILHKYYWPNSYDARSLANLLTQTDALLGVDDARIYNPTTIKSILLSSYARKQSLIGPTAAFIKAGSLASTYTDQDNWINTLQKLLQTPVNTWPASLYPDGFKVIVNQQVARSLGIQKSRPSELTEQLQQSRPAP